MNKTYRITLLEQADGRVVVKHVESATAENQEAPDNGRTQWQTLDKKKFTRGFLNTISQFKTD